MAKSNIARVLERAVNEVYTPMHRAGRCGFAKASGYKCRVRTRKLYVIDGTWQFRCRFHKEVTK